MIWHKFIRIHHETDAQIDFSPRIQLFGKHLLLELAAAIQSVSMCASASVSKCVPQTKWIVYALKHHFWGVKKNVCAKKIWWQTTEKSQAKKAPSEVGGENIPSHKNKTNISILVIRSLICINNMTLIYVQYEI